MSQRLPSRPHLEFLRRHAKDVLRVGRTLYPEWRLADAQNALARGHGFQQWADLKREVVLRRVVAHSNGDAVSSSMSDPVQQTRNADGASITGMWLSQDEATAGRVALEITGGARSLGMTQVIVGAEEEIVANNMTIRPDGREHPLDVGDELRLQAAWSDPRTLEIIVRRGGVIVAEGTYIVSLDANTMIANVSAQSRVFVRVGAAGRNGDVRSRRRASSSRTLLAIALAVIATYGCANVTSRTAAQSSAERDAFDRRAIEALNRHDIAAGLASDVDAVIAQWTDDFVLLPAAGPVVRGKAANAAMVEQARRQLEKFEPVAYEVEFEETTVTGDYAFSWGHFRTVARVRETNEEIASNGKLLRIYQRQLDGRWLMHRTMSTLDAQPPRQ